MASTSYIWSEISQKRFKSVEAMLYVVLKIIDNVTQPRKDNLPIVTIAEGLGFDGAVEVTALNSFDILMKLNHFLKIGLYPLEVAKNRDQIVWGYIDKLDPVSKFYLLTDMGIVKTFYYRLIEMRLGDPMENLPDGLEHLIWEFSNEDDPKSGSDIYRSPTDLDQPTIYPDLGKSDMLDRCNQKWLIKWIVKKFDFEAKRNDLRSILGLQGESQESESRKEAQELSTQYTEESRLLEGQGAYIDIVN
ncbi:hypothetical protein RF11_06665 [Thelohanellus kitauei]|uniref:Uncharacterized protein n=1 Tax=Thelohanellus kitauei TaxID=669202 RepID=A0A0C2M9H7_THEKT|nr:hypothetical protein RF11_06665 [Thelohanellus kitauei]